MIVLASKSATRRAMLDAAGVEYKAVPAEIDERALEESLPGHGPARVALALAQAKAQAVSRERPDTLVLGSDGLFDNLHLEEITEYVRKGPLPRAAEAMADACRRRMCEPQPDHPSKPDDLTFLLYRRRG